MGTMQILLSLALVHMLLAAPPSERKPQNDNDDVTKQVKAKCGDKFKIEDFYPDSCNPIVDNSNVAICYLMLDYIYQGCSHNISSLSLPNVEHYTCPMQNLSHPIKFIEEGKAIIQTLKDKLLCIAACKTQSALCTHLAKVNGWLQDSKTGNKSTLAPEQTEDLVPPQSAVNNEKPTVLGQIHAPVARPPLIVKEKPEAATSQTAMPVQVSSTPLPSSEKPLKSTNVKKPDPPANEVKTASQPAQQSSQNQQQDAVKTDIVGHKDGVANTGAEELGVPTVSPAQNGGMPPGYNGGGEDDLDEFEENKNGGSQLAEPGMGEDDEDDDGVNLNGGANAGAGKPEETKLKTDVDDLQQDTPRIQTNGAFQDTPDSHFFFYFLSFVSVSAVAYVAFHNKNKIFAILLEGRRGRQSRRRPNSAGYRKLDTSLEEAMMSNPSRGSATHVIY